MSAQRHEDSNAPSLSEMEEDERELEAEYKRGFDAGVAYQKTAAPPPKARSLGMQLVKERLAWAATKAELILAARSYIEAQSADSVPLRIAARERLLAALGDKS